MRLFILCQYEYYNIENDLIMRTRFHNFFENSYKCLLVKNENNFKTNLL
jgi:hypothetical protein